MPRLSGIVQADPVSYTATLGSESVTFTFDSAKMTGRWESNVRYAIAAEDTDTVADLLFSVFIHWDVVDDAGSPVPISPEILMDLPGKALRALFEGMQKTILPSDAEGNASSATSSTPSMDFAPPQAAPQNGPAPSPSPPLSTSPSPP